MEKVELEKVHQWVEKFRDPLGAADNAMWVLNEIGEFVRETLGPNAAGFLLGELPEQSL